VVNIYEGDNEVEMLNLVFNGMRLLQDDYLGGSGSRGSGQISFNIEKVIERGAAFYAANDVSSQKEYNTVQVPDELTQKN